MAIGRPRLPLSAHIERRGEDDCWQWRGAMSGNGYGVVHWGGRSFSAHRVAYEQAYGPIPAGQCVCHRCDNKRCCNPRHLWLGSSAANTADRDAKKRQAHGERHWKAKLTEDDVRKARAIYASGKISQQAVADAFGVSRPTMSHVLRGAHWREVK